VRPESASATLQGNAASSSLGSLSGALRPRPATASAASGSSTWRTADPNGPPQTALQAL
jgi:hypothetical protein